MALPKFSEMSTRAQIGVILGVGALLWFAFEYNPMSEPVPSLSRVRASNAEKESDRVAREARVAPLRPLEGQLEALEAQNQQLQQQLETLLTIVPAEKDIDDFMEQVQREATVSGVVVRRFTRRQPIEEEFHVEVPFELELDGSYYDVLEFYQRLEGLTRIINVSDLKLGSIEAGRSVGNTLYAYSPSETVVAVCTATTYFSTEGETAPSPEAGQPAQ
ncbi:MAG: type 4a pilus biogenesis protein PilO [Acidobacteria bacterium]|nr:type 4a pilus biogenesis protein PilO [Acidobacteriota bacterium]